MNCVYVTFSISSGIKQIHVYYYDEYGGWVMGVVRDGDSLYVQQNTTINVATILFNDGGSAPVTCSGSVDTWVIYDEYGNWNDPFLSIGTTDKTFSFTGYGETDGVSSVSMGIILSDGISEITLRYCLESYYYTDSASFDTEFSVDANSTNYVTGISFTPGYGHPVWCTGETSWQMTYEDGSFADPSLQVFSADKNFVFSATYTGTSGGGDGLVWINGAWYQPYIYNGSQWVKATPYIYNDGWEPAIKR